MQRAIRILSLCLTLGSMGSLPLQAMRAQCDGCSSVLKLDDGHWMVTDCWCKTCQTWATTSTATVDAWIGAAYRDGAMC